MIHFKGGGSTVTVTPRHPVNQSNKKKSLQDLNADFNKFHLHEQESSRLIV